MVALNQVDEVIADKLSEIISNASGLVPEEYRPFFTLGIFLVLIVIYAIFVWKFYRFLAKRDLLELDLKKYNKVEHAFWNKFIALILFTLEFIIILPIVVFFWFIVMALLLLFLAKELPAGTILLVSAVIVGAVRIVSYYSQDLAKDLAKMFPFTILAIALITPGFFDFTNVISRVTEIGNLLSHALIYLLITIAIEVLLRVFYMITPEKSGDSESLLESEDK